MSVPIDEDTPEELKAWIRLGNQGFADGWNARKAGLEKPEMKGDGPYEDHFKRGWCLAR